MVVNDSCCEVTFQCEDIKTENTYCIVTMRWSYPGTRHHIKPSLGKGLIW